jgi:ElaB/YqjD/DUF883 family membrane-anchored ribosome-binding protein
MENIHADKSYKSASGAIAGLGEKLSADVNDVRDDVKSLKENVSALGQSLKDEACAKTSELKDLASEKLEDVMKRGDESLKFLDDEVKANPRSAVAIAFAAGILANFLLRR